MNAAAGPSAEDQVAFLGKIERLLSEGQFAATYKYALLVALADLAVEYGSDENDTLDLPVRAIAEKFIELYWRQGAPYGDSIGDGDYSILLQNAGRQASIIGLVDSLRRAHGTLSRARRSHEWPRAVTETVRLLQTMPLWRLQVLRSERLEFLYEKSPSRGQIRLKHGVAANLRRFHGMIVRLAQTEWLHFIQALPANARLLGPTADLGQFLFGAERSALFKIAEPLAEAQSGRCLYCQRAVRTGEIEHIDHFVPWSRYPRDLAHNLVLAHAQCNRDKGDLLAAETHLERWIRRNEDRGNAIGEAGVESSLIVDLSTTIGVARWAYAHGQRLHARTWLHGDAVEPLTGRWRTLLEA